jgi:hypothetical protein
VVPTTALLLTACDTDEAFVVMPVVANVVPVPPAPPTSKTTWPPQPMAMTATTADDAIESSPKCFVFIVETPKRKNQQALNAGAKGT